MVNRLGERCGPTRHDGLSSRARQFQHRGRKSDQGDEWLSQLIKALRKDFDAPEARFVSASLGQTKDGSKGGDGQILDAMKAVANSKDPELEGTVGFVYSHPLSKGGSSSGHYSGNPETYQNIGEAMGKAMVELLGAEVEK